MTQHRFLRVLVSIAVCILAWAYRVRAEAVSISVDWGDAGIVSRSTPTLQVVVNPMLRHGGPLHDAAFTAVRQLGADDVRFVPWLPYPRLAVAELRAPTTQSTSWDFSLIDPLIKDFFDATSGHTTIINFSTIPAWMFTTAKPVDYPADPNEVTWNYTQGTELRDPSAKMLGDYYARLVSWYADGGFTDERGLFHSSGYHYSIPVWEVLNEVDFEHHTTPELYTRRYDAIVAAIHAASPQTQFMALALGDPKDPHWFEYFLNPANHRPNIRIDYISYHFYATPSSDQTLDQWQFTFFDQADGFLNSVRYIEGIRKRLSPQTKTDCDELGVILPNDSGTDSAGKPVADLIPPLYWNAAGSLYAYLFVNLSRQQIDIIGESQLVGYPSQYPSVSMMNWKTGKPNARYWVLKLIKDNFGPGDRLVRTHVTAQSAVEAQAFATKGGHKLLLINKRNRGISIVLPKAFTGCDVDVVDGETSDRPARENRTAGRALELAPFSVAVATALPQK